MVFLCCSAGELVKTFELSSEEIQLHRTMMGSLNSEVTCARYNHNGKILASCSVDGGICLDVASSGELLSRFFAPVKSISERRINSVYFSSGSRFLASGGHDGCVRVWDLKTQEVTQAYNISASAVTSVTFSGYKDEHAVAGSESGAISVCDVRTSDTAGFLTVDPKNGPCGVFEATGERQKRKDHLGESFTSPDAFMHSSVNAAIFNSCVHLLDLWLGSTVVPVCHQQPPRREWKKRTRPPHFTSPHLTSPHLTSLRSLTIRFASPFTEHLATTKQTAMLSSKNLFLLSALVAAMCASSPLVHAEEMTYGLKRQQAAANTYASGYTTTGGAAAPDTANISPERLAIMQRQKDKRGFSPYAARAGVNSINNPTTVAATTTSTTDVPATAAASNTVNTDPTTAAAAAPVAADNIVNTNTDTAASPDSTTSSADPAAPAEETLTQKATTYLRA